MTDDLYQAARAAFAEYAAANAPHLPPDPLSALQVRLARWEAVQFSYQPPWTAVLGVCEEIGELEEADIDIAKLRDAVADTMIFATQLCTAYRLDFGTILRARDRALVRFVGWFGAMRPTVIAGGRLARAVLKEAQGIRGADREATRRAVADAIHLLLNALGEIEPVQPIDEVYAEVAERIVLRRNWIANPMDGGTP